ncbi:MAG: hypothetical protein ACTHK6_04185 [Solirubrobacterales bacterium]
MSEERSGYLRVLRLDRAQAIQLVLVGLVLALGVNLIAVFITEKVNSGLALVFGAITICLALGLALRSVYRPRPRYREFQGYVVYDRDENELVGLRSGYHLGDSIARYLEAGLAESDQIKAIWSRNPIGALLDGDESGRGDPRKGLELVRQACEYFVLRSFSTRLSEHFTSGEFAKDELATLSHIDLPDVLLENRFLRIFAEPMEDRAPFSPSEGGDDTRVVSQRGGALYEPFRLVHPKGWRVIRSAHRDIEIKTRRFVLRVQPRCEGYIATLPPLYLSNYLGLHQEIEANSGRYAALRIDVSIEIAPRRAWLMTRRGWRYYRWIDRWIGDLEPQISMDAYLDEIGFATSETTLRLLDNRPGLERSITVADHRSDGRPADPAVVPKSPHAPFAAGDRVEHVTFGVGQIESLEPGGVIVVRFEGDEKDHRKLMADYAPIRRIS